MGLFDSLFDLAEDVVNMAVEATGNIIVEVASIPEKMINTTSNVIEKTLNTIDETIDKL